MSHARTPRKPVRRWLHAALVASLASGAFAQTGMAPGGNPSSYTDPPSPRSTLPPAAERPMPQAEQQELVDAARTTLNNFLRDPDMDWLQRNIGQARAVLVAPIVVKAGWIFGGSGGRAVLFARNASTGAWHGPAFYNVGAASVGFQAGIAVSETVTLVMTDKALSSLMESSVKLGGDASIAAGPVGAGAATDVRSDFVSFSRSKGVYGGLNLEGSIVSVADDWNRAYYGRDASPSDIVLTAKVRNPKADALANDLARSVAPQRTTGVK